MNEQEKQTILKKYPNIDIENTNEDILKILLKEINTNKSISTNYNKLNARVKHTNSLLNKKSDDKKYEPVYKEEDLVLTDNLSDEIKDALTPAEKLKRDDEIKLKIREEEARKREFENKLKEEEENIKMEKQKALVELVGEIVLDEEDTILVEQELKNFNLEGKTDEELTSLIKKAHSIVKEYTPKSNNIHQQSSSLGKNEIQDKEESEADIDKRVQDKINASFGVKPSGSLDLSKIGRIYDGKTNLS